MVELLDLSPLWFAQSLENGGRVGDRASNDLAYTLVGPVGRQRGTAIGDKPVKIKHSHILSAEAVILLCPDPVTNSKCGQNNSPSREISNQSVILTHTLPAYL